MQSQVHRIRWRAVNVIQMVCGVNNYFKLMHVQLHLIASYYHGGLMDETLGFRAGILVVRIPDRGKCWLSTITAYAKVKHQHNVDRQNVDRHYVEQIKCQQTLCRTDKMSTDIMSNRQNFEQTKCRHTKYRTDKTSTDRMSTDKMHVKTKHWRDYIF